MREIKFRAWFKDTNDMVEWKELMGFKGLADLLNDAKNDYPSVKVMQYTGMKDKNGRQIWEGDIIPLKIKHETVYEYFDDVVKNHVVKFINGSFALQAEPGLWYYLHDKIDDCKVIGNIYQNPELLKSGDPT